MILVIKLTKEKETIIDDEDYSLVKEFKWHYQNCGYARTAKVINGVCIYIYLHRLILGLTDELIEVDHINGNGLDNRKCNLRLASHQQNIQNYTKLIFNTSSNYKGVYFDKQTCKWRAQINISKRKKSLGRFSTELEAAKAYNQAAIIHYGQYAKLNDIKEEN